MELWVSLCIAWSGTGWSLRVPFTPNHAMVLYAGSKVNCSCMDDLGGVSLDDHCGPFQPRPFYDL